MCDGDRLLSRALDYRELVIEDLSNENAQLRDQNARLESQVRDFARVLVDVAHDLIVARRAFYGDKAQAKAMRVWADTLNETRKVAQRERDDALDVLARKIFDRAARERDISDRGTAA